MTTTSKFSYVLLIVGAYLIMIDYLVFCAVSAIFQPCNGNVPQLMLTKLKTYCINRTCIFREINCAL